MKKTGKHQKRVRQTAVMMRIGLLFLAVAVVFNGYTLAKYFMEKNKKVPIAAKNFYFESDLLAVSGGALPQYTLQAGVNNISFCLKNYPDELRSSEVDIAYTVVLKKEDAEKETKTGTIVAGRNDVPISFADLEAGTYTVTATATKPYTQTLQARFTIVNTDYDLSCIVSDAAGSPNLKVTVTTTDYSGPIEVSWPDGVLPDNTDELLENAQGNNYTIQVNEQSEYTFQFFKTNPNADYTNQISVRKA